MDHAERRPEPRSTPKIRQPRRAGAARVPRTSERVHVAHPPPVLGSTWDRPEHADRTRIRRSTADPSIGRDGGPVDDQVASRIRASAGGPLADAIRQPMERAFGADFNAVRIHEDSDVATSLNAIAFTHGTDIHFAPDQFAPTTSTGQHLLAHELAHVVQQGGGPVRRSPDDVIRRKDPRSKNPHNPQTGVTSHHVIPHELLETMIDKFQGNEREEVLRASLPAFGDLTLGNFIAQVSVAVEYNGQTPNKVTELDPPEMATKVFSDLSSTEKGSIKFTVEDAGKVTFEEFNAMWDQLAAGDPVTHGDTEVSGLRDVAESFYEWQGGNLFYGPERIEPGAKDGFDYDAAEIYGTAHADKLESIYKQLRALEKKSDPLSLARIKELLAEMTAAAKSVGVPRYDPTMWLVIDTQARLNVHDTLLPTRTKTSKIGASISKAVLRRAIRVHAADGAYAMLGYVGRTAEGAPSGKDSPDSLFEAKGRSLYLKESQDATMLLPARRKRDEIASMMVSILLGFFGLRTE